MVHLPAAVAYVRDVLAAFECPWFLTGGWAVDAWLGRRTRDHGDVDITVFHHDQRAVFEHFSGWAVVAHDPNVDDDTTEPWNGRHLDLPAHVHVRDAAFEFEVLLNERSGDDWVLNRENRVVVPVARSTTRSAWGVPTAPPEVVLFFKAGGSLTASEIAAGDGDPRPRDDQDFFALLPVLTDPARDWLREAIAQTRPEHPWLAHLAEARTT
jgi:Aminoglycoside-2''-adenylyltransferase